jgi:hypothetical protein
MQNVMKWLCEYEATQNVCTGCSEDISPVLSVLGKKTGMQEQEYYD